jgi:hypothetical protein
VSTSAGRAKRDRERVRQERAALKRARKLEGASEVASSDDAPTPSVRRSQDEVLEELAALHQKFEAKVIGFEDFESAKEHLMAQLDV